MEQYFPVDPHQVWQVQNSKGQAIHVYEMPLQESRRVGVHNEGDVVTVIGRRGKWLHVRNTGQYAINGDAWILAFQPGIGVDVINNFDVGFGALHTAPSQLMEYLPVQQLDYVPLQPTQIITAPPLEYIPVQAPQIEFMPVPVPAQVDYMQVQAPALKERQQPAPPPLQDRRERASANERPPFDEEVSLPLSSRAVDLNGEPRSF